MPKSNQWAVPRERSWTFCKSATPVIEMYLRETINLGVQNCSFHEMIISDNTEGGTLKLTCCSCQKKVHETENLSARNTEIQSKTYVWAEVFFFLTCDQAFYVFFLQFTAGSILSQFKVIACLEIHHTHTLTKRLLGNLTDLRFAFGFCLAFKSGLWICLH